MFELIRTWIIAWAEAGYLPADLSYQFVVNAVISGLMIGPLLGGFGTLLSLIHI